MSSPVKHPPRPEAQVRHHLERMRDELEKALAKRIDVDQFIRVCATEFNTGGARMREADPLSFIAACVEAAQLGLSPNGALGECYLIPRKKNEKVNGEWRSRTIVSCQLGYPGLVKLARRGGDVLDVSAEVVHANDEFSVRLGTARGIEHTPWYCLGHADPGEIIAAYATAEIRGAAKPAFRVLARAELEDAARRSGNPKSDDWSDVWTEHFAAMARKTAVTRLCKLLPIPDAAREAVNRDERRELNIEEEPARVTQLRSETGKLGNQALLGRLGCASDADVIDTEATGGEA